MSFTRDDGTVYIGLHSPWRATSVRQCIRVRVGVGPSGLGPALWLEPRAVLRWGRGRHLSPRFTCCPRFKSYSWPFWRDYWGHKMLQNRKSPPSRGSGPRWGAYNAPPDRLTDGEGTLCPLPRTSPSLLALRVSFLRVTRSNPLQSWQPY